MRMQKQEDGASNLLTTVLQFGGVPDVKNTQPHNIST